MWTPVNVIISRSTVTMSFGNINFNSPLQLYSTVTSSFVMVCNYISELSEAGGGSKYSLLSKAYHEVPYFSIICNVNDLFLMMCLNLNLSLICIIADVGKHTMFSFKVIRISFQSICTTSNNYLLFNVI